MYRNIIWDVDGTLFDSYPGIARAMHAAVAELGGQETLQEIHKLTKVSLDLCSRQLGAKYGIEPEAILKTFARHYENEVAAEALPFPGVLELCRRIQADGGKNVIVTHRGRAGTAALLAAHGAADLFAGFVAGDDGFPRKPDPAAFRAALERNGLRPEETLNVGDREIDVEAGQAAGLVSCLFAPEPPSFETKADLIVASYTELDKFLFATLG